MLDAVGEHGMEARPDTENKKPQLFDEKQRLGGVERSDPVIEKHFGHFGCMTDGFSEGK